MTAGDTIKDVAPAPTAAAVALEAAAEALRSAAHLVGGPVSPVEVADGWMRLATLIVQVDLAEQGIVQQ